MIRIMCCWQGSGKVAPPNSETECHPMPRQFACALFFAHLPALAAAQHAGPHAVPLTESGQSAFAAIAEVVARLDADPATDWSRVDIPALAEHLADMDHVMTGAEVVMRPVAGGLVFEATGVPRVAAALRRMLPAHAATMSGNDGLTFEAETAPEGATLTVSGTEEALSRARALGLQGLLALGQHHKMHHWAIASGQMPHGH